MKWFALILSIYALLLTVVPCADAHNPATGTTDYELVQTETPATDCISSCSPFCSCLCCQSIVPVVQNQISFATQATSTEYILTNYNLLENTHPDCFRPPIV